MIKLRPYQAQAVESTWNYMSCNPGNPAIVVPTGGGKSVIIAETVRQAVERWNARVGIVAGSKELVRQNFEKMRSLWPECDCGIYSASLNRRDRFNRVLFLQAQSVFKRMHELGRFDMLLFDEFHLVPTKGEGQYRSLIGGAKKFNTNLRTVGYSATPYRLGEGPVCSPLHIFNAIAYEANVGDLIRDGYLSNLTSRLGSVRADLSGVHVRGGEYVEKELADAMDRDDLVEAACADMVMHAADRQSWVVFAVSVKHAMHVVESLAKRGVTAACVHGETPAGERDRLISDFQAKRLRALVNVNVLTTGFDAPNIDCVIMLRPTKSTGLYVQMVGRGFRLAPGKTDCLVLCYSGNVLEHGPIDAIRVRHARRQGEGAKVEKGKVKECPACHAALPLSARVCECGKEFGSADPAHSDRPVDAPVLSTERERVRNLHAVNSVSYARHDKPGKTPSLKATYQCGLRRFSEWVCIEHDGMARAKALRWWQARTADQCPRSVEEALPLAWKLPTPAEILVDETDKYPEIKEHRFSEPTATEQERTSANDPVGAEHSEGAGSAAGTDPVQGLRGVPGWLVRALDGNGSARRAA